MAQSIGKVSQIIGPVVDVDFSGENNPLPRIYDALEIENPDGTKLILEVHLTLVKKPLERYLWTLQMVSVEELMPKLLGVLFKCLSAKMYTDASLM